MKHWFVLLAATAAFTAFAPASNAQVSVQTPGVGVRIGEPTGDRARSARHPGVQVDDRAGNRAGRQHALGDQEEVRLS